MRNGGREFRNGSNGLRHEGHRDSPDNAPAYHFASYVVNQSLGLQLTPHNPQMTISKHILRFVKFASSINEISLSISAEAKYNIGTAHIYRIQGRKADNLESAIRLLKEALEVYSKDKFSSEWAKVQNNLSLAYLYRIQGRKAENIEKSIMHSKAILAVYTSEEYPEEWAKTQLNLGNAYLFRILGVGGNPHSV